MTSEEKREPSVHRVRPRAARGRSFVEPPAAAVAAGAPRLTLVAFEKVWLAAGTSADVPFALRAHDFTLPRREGGRAAAEGAWTVVVGDARVAVHVA